MSDPTSNSNSVQADAFYIWDPVTKTHVNLQSSIVGLAPETLNTLTELANAVGNNPNFASDLQATTAGLQTQIDDRAPKLNPTFSGTVGGISKAMVGLGSVDNTSDANKPTTQAVTNLLAAKAPLANPAFTGTVTR